jgi:uncharacterized membrane protein YoaT (DUF817 family)
MYLIKVTCLDIYDNLFYHFFLNRYRLILSTLEAIVPYSNKMNNFMCVFQNILFYLLLESVLLEFHQYL